MAGKVCAGTRRFHVETSWNRSDTLHIVITLGVGLLEGDHQLRVSTRNGVTDDMTFSWAP